MTGDHAHHSLRAGERHQRPLLVAFVLTAAFFVVEVVAGLLTNSLALLSDAGHMLTDVLGLGMALAAIQLANRSARLAREHGAGQRTFGLYRLEILAAFVNALLLSGVAVYVLVEAVTRLGDDAEVDSLPMLVVAVLGLVVNLVAFRLLRAGAAESLNVKGAYLEVTADLLGSLGVIVAASVIEATGWEWVDPLVAVGIGLFVLPRTWRLGRQAVRILIQASPPHIDPAEVRAQLSGIAGVADVHDLHVWTLTSDMEAASAHLMVTLGTDTHGVLDQARVLLQQQFSIDHATLQVEPDDHSGCDELNW